MGGEGPSDTEKAHKSRKAHQKPEFEIILEIILKVICGCMAVFWAIGR